MRQKENPGSSLLCHSVDLKIWSWPAFSLPLWRMLESSRLAGWGRENHENLWCSRCRCCRSATASGRQHRPLCWLCLGTAAPGLCSSNILLTLTHIHVPQKHDFPIGFPYLLARRPPPTPFTSRASVSWAPLEYLVPAPRWLRPQTHENPDSWEPVLVGTHGDFPIQPPRRMEEEVLQV